MVTIKLTKDLIGLLKEKGVTTLHGPGVNLPDKVVFEPPCSIKWMDINHSLELGAFSYAVSGFYFACRIGRYCSFGEQVQIGRHGHPLNWVSSSPFFYWPYDQVLDQKYPSDCDVVAHKDFKHQGPPVRLQHTEIGNDVWIGHGAFVLPGVKIGHGAAIAAKSVVTKDVPPYAIVGGAPAKVLRMRFSGDKIEALLNSRWWEYAPWHLKGATVDDAEAFVDYVNILRERKVLGYSSDKVQLALLAGVAKE